MENPTSCYPGAEVTGSAIQHFNLDPPPNSHPPYSDRIYGNHVDAHTYDSNNYIGYQQHLSQTHPQQLHPHHPTPHHQIDPSLHHHPHLYPGPQPNHSFVSGYHPSGHHPLDHQAQQTHHYSSTPNHYSHYYDRSPLHYTPNGFGVPGTPGSVPTPDATLSPTDPSMNGNGLGSPHASYMKCYWNGNENGEHNSMQSTIDSGSLMSNSMSPRPSHMSPAAMSSASSMSMAPPPSLPLRSPSHSSPSPQHALWSPSHSQSPRTTPSPHVSNVAPPHPYGSPPSQSLGSSNLPSHCTPNQGLPPQNAASLQMDSNVNPLHSLHKMVDNNDVNGKNETDAIKTKDSSPNVPSNSQDQIGAQKHGSALAPNSLTAASDQLTSSQNVSESNNSFSTYYNLDQSKVCASNDSHNSSSSSSTISSSTDQTAKAKISPASKSLKIDQKENHLDSKLVNEIDKQDNNEASNSLKREGKLECEGGDWRASDEGDGLSFNSWWNPANGITKANGKMHSPIKSNPHSLLYPQHSSSFNHNNGISGSGKKNPKKNPNGNDKGHSSTSNDDETPLKKKRGRPLGRKNSPKTDAQNDESTKNHAQSSSQKSVPEPSTPNIKRERHSKESKPSICSAQDKSAAKSKEDPKTNEAIQGSSSETSRNLSSQYGDVKSPLTDGASLGSKNPNSNPKGSSECKPSTSKSKPKKHKHSSSSTPAFQPNPGHNPKEKERKRYGPYIHVDKTKKNQSAIYTIVNAAHKDEPKDLKKKYPHGQGHLARKQSFVGVSKKKISVNNLSTGSTVKDETWLCSLCHRGPHIEGLGDLFGPYYIAVENEQQYNHTQPSTSSTPYTAPPSYPSMSTRRKSESLDESNDPVQQTPTKRKKESKLGQSLLKPQVETPKKAAPQTPSKVTRPDLDSLTQREIWFHEDCVVWSSGVYLIGNRIRNLEELIKDSAEHICSVCKLSGASMGCVSKGCTFQSHYLCAKHKGCELDEENFLMYCTKHKRDAKERKALAQQQELSSP